MIATAHLPRRFAGGLLLGLIACGCADSTSPSIRAPDLERHVLVLAADGMAGRETGRPGVAQAEEYLAAEFARIGLTPLPGRDDFFLPITLYRRGYDPTATRMELRIGERQWVGEPGELFRPFGFSDDGVVDGQVVFAGYGITAPEQGYDDYRDLDVEGKIALVLRHDPSESNPEGAYDGSTEKRHGHFRTKAANAAAHGAVGMILVTDPINHEPGDDLRIGGDLNLEPGERSFSPEVSGFIAVHASRGWVDSALEPSGASLESWQRAVDSGDLPQPQSALSARIALRRDPEDRPVSARNVAGFIEGSDPAWKDQWIVVGAHHDHLGAFTGEGDTVFNGADDNASGVSGLLELAESFGDEEHRPGRSLVFVTFTGEEKGLLGSRSVLAAEDLPRERVVFMLNLDMIGRNADRPLRVYGDGYVRGLRQAAEEANEGPGLRLEFAGAGYAGNSDHHPFFEADLPFCFLFTGVHDDYHRLGDHVEKLDFERMERIVQLARGMLDRVAGWDEPPGFVHQLTWLGAQVELLDSSRVPTVTRVDPGSPAERVGLLAGDVVAALDESELDDPREVGRRFREIEPGSSTSLRVIRDEEQVVLEIHRATPGYLGVAPRAIDEELRAQHQLRADQGVLLLRIVPEGPAEEAGLLPEDILLSLGGRWVNQDNLTFLLEQIGEGKEVEAIILREGERHSIDLTLRRRP